MSDNGHLDILPQRSLGGRRWDYVCAAILLLPLVLLAFQGDIIFGIAERINYQGRYTAVHEAERSLNDVHRQVREVEAQIDAAGGGADANALRDRRTVLAEQEEDLKREVKNLRDPLNARTAYWNFSAVKRWPLSWLMGPLLALVVWFSVPAEERRRMFQEALDSGARQYGLIWALASVGLFWIGVWQQQALHRDVTQHMGDPGYTPGFVPSYAWVLTYVSLICWSAAGVYAFAGRRALGRVWAPMAVVMTLMILNYGPMSSRWTNLWDTDPKWGYGYFIGPLAAMLFYFKLSESNLKPGGAGERALHDLSSLGSMLPFRMPVALEAHGCEAGGIPRTDVRAGRLLAAASVILLAVVGAALFMTQVLHRGPVLLTARFSWYPLALGVAWAALAAWQMGDREGRGETALRLGGLALLLAAVGFRAGGASVRVAFAQELSMIGVLLGGTLAALGYHVFRVAWVAVSLLTLAIPWPERTYVSLAQIPQKWSAMMAERFMLLMGYTVTRDGNSLQVLPGPEGKLLVAEQCSGLQMLFAFVTLSIVYAYISKRPPWRRVIVFVSSFPIAIVANFARVSLMALLFKWGYKDVAKEHLQHVMTGFVVMLPLAFFLLYVEMRVLDLIEWLADKVAAPENPAGDAAEKTDGGAPGAV